VKENDLAASSCKRQGVGDDLLGLMASV